MILTKWQPLPDIPSEIYVEGIHHDYEGFRIIMKGPRAQDRTFRIAFDPPLVYRHMEEGDLVSSAGHVRLGLYRVKDSELTQWFLAETQRNDETAFSRYLIVTPTSIVDVIAEVKPVVMWLN